MTASLIPQVALVLFASAHLAWVGLLAGGATAATAIDALGGARRRTAALRVSALGNPGLLAAAWLEVTAIGSLLLAGVRHPQFEQTAAFWAGVLIPLAAGVGAASLFRGLLADDRLPRLRVAIGLGGIGLVISSCFVLVGGSGTLLQPEWWATAEPPWRFLPTWSGVGRFTEFTLLSFAASGIFIAGPGRQEPAPEEGRFLRRFGGRLALASLVAWPPVALFTLLNVPAIALSSGVWAAAALALLGGGAVAWRLSEGGERPVAARPLGAAAVALLALVVVGEQIARERALRPVVVAGLSVPYRPAPPAERPPVTAAAPAPAVAGDATGAAAAGKAVFDRVCSICHRFDARKVGPPFDAVVPKYRKDPEALRAFIRAPVKKDPAYPPMPRPAVTDPEIDAVVAWLLERAGR